MPKKIKTKADQPPQGEKKGTIQCRYCPRSFSRRNCYRHHLTKHKDILYAEKNELETLLNEQENQPQIRLTMITNEKRPPLAPISLNELTTTYDSGNSESYEDDESYGEQEMVEKLHKILNVYSIISCD